MWAIIYILALVMLIVGLGITLYNPSTTSIVFVNCCFLVMLVSLTQASITV